MLTMSPPNDELEVNSATDVIGAAVSGLTAAVFSVTVTVNRSELTGVAGATEVTCSG